ncbi:MAG: hypothetical protein MI923_29905 [Phycisphaerales bacterium]|nr:hypothetical protein [Phycisphaerales bacterium]
MNPRRICLWSGPRNVSTALMYAFAQRSDACVVDEPLYAYYLRTTGVDHPGRAEVLAHMDADGRHVVEDVILGPCDRPVLFMKQMAHHLVGLDRGFLRQTDNVLLIRDPSEMLPSLAKNIPNPTLRDTGLKMQSDLFNELRSLGQHPPILDARQLLLDPRGVLSILCDQLAISFEEAMLSWPEGARPEDGIWAPHWYENVHRSKGFQPYQPKTATLSESLQLLLEECRPYYEALEATAIRARTEKK